MHSRVRSPQHTEAAHIMSWEALQHGPGTWAVEGNLTIALWG